MPKKITDLPSLTSADDTDILPIVDTSANVTKQVTVTGVAAAVAASIPDGTLTYAQTTGTMWWEELGRATLASAGDTLDVASFPAKKFLKIIVQATNTGGTIGSGGLTFNGDTANNYTKRVSDNGGADTSAAAAPNLYFMVAALSGSIFVDAEVTNIQTAEKQMISHATGVVSGTATAPIRNESVGKWANTSTQITRVTLTNGGTGDFAIGSQLIVLGHD